MKLVHAQAACPLNLDFMLRNTGTCPLAAGHALTAKLGLVAAEQDSRNQPASRGAGISQLSPRLQSEWMPDENHHLDNKVITRHSHHKAWWSCSQCPDGHPHVWQARVDDRSTGQNCPYCSGHQVCQHNSLATMAPAVVQYWHKEKNLPLGLSPDPVTAGSKKIVHWKCSACLHEWQARISDKARRNSGCPKCARAQGGRSRDSIRGSIQPLPNAITPCLLSGIMISMLKRETILTTLLREVQSAYGGCVDNATKATSIVGKLLVHVEPHMQPAAPFALIADSVSATLYKSSILSLQLILTAKLMGSLQIK